MTKCLEYFLTFVTFAAVNKINTMEYRLSIKDTDYNSPALDWLRCGQKMGWVKVVEQVSPLQLPDIDRRMQKIFHELEEEKVIKHKYDYVWLKSRANGFQHAKNKPLSITENIGSSQIPTTEAND